MRVDSANEKVRQALKANPNDCSLDEVVALCSDLTWNQVFLAIDYLSRTGQVQLSMDQTRSYRVKVLVPSPFRNDTTSSVA